MSVEIPKMAVVFGSVTPPQGDVIECRVHLGCTKEVGSFECLLQNWNKKYSSGGTSPINVGVDGHIDIGRGSNVPQIITCRVESVKCESSPTENYIRVSGRCWGERIFRRVVTKTYENEKGEDIVKDVVANYAGLNYVRGEYELIIPTDTTYQKLEYENTPVFDILKFIAASADKAGVIGFDFRIEPDGLFAFFPKNYLSSSVSLSEKIEVSEYRKDIHRIRNKIMVYGLADKSVPIDKDAWTESLTPTDGNWYPVSGTTTFDTATKIKGTGSIKTYAANLYYAACRFVLNAGKEVNSNLYPFLSFFVRREAAFNGNVNVILYDTAEHSASHMFNIGAGEWFQRDVKVGVRNADVWDVESGFDWTQIKIIRFDCWFTGSGTGSFWVDGLFFGGRRYEAVREDSGSQNAYGLRELTETDEELVSDNECDLRAKSLLDYFKNPAEYLTVRSTVIDYGNSPLFAGDKIHVTLPNENVDSDFRIESVEYRVDAKTQTLEITLELGKVPPMLADYLYGLRATTINVEKLARTKLGKGMGAVGGGGSAPEWIWPTFIGPKNDVAAITQFRTKNIAGTSIVDHHFDPSDHEHGLLGRDACRWLEIWTKYLNAGAQAKVGQLNIGDVIVITPARILQNVLADAGIITSGQFLLARMPRGASGQFLRAYGVDFDPMYANIAAADLPAHSHSGQDLSPNQVNCNTMSIAVSCNRQYSHPSNQQCVYAGSVAWENCPRFYCVNYQSGDVLFQNNFRITESEKLGFNEGLAFLNSKGKVLMVLDKKGDLYVAGKIQRGLSKRGKSRHKIARMI